MKFAAHIAVVGMLASASCLAQTKPAGANAVSSPAKLERMPESLELRYALSALPRICGMAQRLTYWTRPKDTF